MRVSFLSKLLTPSHTVSLQENRRTDHERTLAGFTTGVPSFSTGVPSFSASRKIAALSASVLRTLSVSLRVGCHTHTEHVLHGIKLSDLSDKFGFAFDLQEGRRTLCERPFLASRKSMLSP